MKIRSINETFLSLPPPPPEHSSTSWQSILEIAAAMIPIISSIIMMTPLIYDFILEG